MKKIFSIIVSLVLLQTTVCAQEEELPAIKSENAVDFFIPATVIKAYNITEGKGDAWMKVYDNTDEKAKLQRVNDIRWEASSKEEAIKWYNDNLTMLSESGLDVTDKVNKPIGVDAWHVYDANENMKKMMEALGMKQHQYTYTFVVGKYVAKIFVTVNEATSLKESWSFVREGLIAILKASGNPKMASLVL